MHTTHCSPLVILSSSSPPNVYLLFLCEYVCIQVCTHIHIPLCLLLLLLLLFLLLYFHHSSISFPLLLLNAYLQWIPTYKIIILRSSTMLLLYCSCVLVPLCTLNPSTVQYVLSPIITHSRVNHYSNYMSNIIWHNNCDILYGRCGCSTTIMKYSQSIRLINCLSVRRQNMHQVTRNDYQQTRQTDGSLVNHW